MRQFLKNVLLFFSPLLVIVAGIEGYLQYYPSTFRLKANYINSNKNNIEVLVLGSSHNQAAINPEFFSKKNVANLAFGGQDIQLDSKLLSKYITELPNLKYVFLELGYHSLETAKGSGFERNSLYLRFYSINNFGRPSSFRDYSIFLSNPNLYMSFLNPFKEKTPVNEYGFATTLSKFERNRFQDMHFDTTIINKDRDNDFITRHNYDDIKTYGINKIIFEQMISECIKYDITPVIVIPPVYFTYYEEMLPAKKQRRDNFVKYCLDKYPALLIFDYEYNSDFIITDFANEDHLDPQGAKKFTYKLDSLLKGIGTN